MDRLLCLHKPLQRFLERRLSDRSALKLKGDINQGVSAGNLFLIQAVRFLGAEIIADSYLVVLVRGLELAA